jgi:protein TonB
MEPPEPEVSPITGRPLVHLDARAGRRGFASAITAHSAIVALIVFGVFAAEELEDSGFDLPGLVFLVQEGPGGGGGGGGDESPEEPAESLELAVQNAPEPDELFLQDPEAIAEELLEDAVNAPFAPNLPDPDALASLIRDTSNLLRYSGPGRDRGAGTGQGGGRGEGDGDGIGEGTGGGFGGGAYRIGSGVEPPQLRRQVTPEYTDNALARKIEGIVILEVVILKSGRVGPARIIRSLDAGLDAKAVAAVRQWTFLPGRYRGEAVDVLAEIEVEFRLL